MPDTKTDEAIALARRIVQAGDVGEYRWPEETTRDLARALIDATSPGAQYRAGMEAATEVIHKRIEADRAVHCGTIARATLDRDAIISGAHIAAIRAAIAALPASPEPTVGIKQALREMDFHEYVVESDSEKASRLLMEAADFFGATLAKADSSAWKCLLTYAPERDMTEIERHIMDLNKKITGALVVAEDFGGIDGADHKAWIIDQMVRCLTGDYYEDWVTQVCSGPERESALYQWNVGIAP